MIINKAITVNSIEVDFCDAIYNLWNHSEIDCSIEEIIEAIHKRNYSIDDFVICYKQ